MTTSEEARTGGPEALRLNRQVCFAMYSASRAATAAYRPMLEELGLTYPQYLAMLVLWEAEPRSVRELARATSEPSSTADFSVPLGTWQCARVAGWILGQSLRATAQLACP